MIGKRFRSLPFIFANDNYTLRDCCFRRQKAAQTATYFLTVYLKYAIFLINKQKGCEFCVEDNSDENHTTNITDSRIVIMYI